MAEIKKLAVRKGDTVIVGSGDDKGKKGKVLEVSPKEGKVIVEVKGIDTGLAAEGHINALCISPVK